MKEQKEKKNQTTEVLKYLQSGKYLTQDIAGKLFGTQRLGAIIFNLRKRGHDIRTVMIDGKTRYGDTVKFAKYIYVNEEEA